jgi:2-keto-4-pentenoate hydratase/2-oxohepta-3-ene-1,7-dioic acid hydratase in catechol pathway
MKFVSFRAGNRGRYGLVVGDGIVDLTTRRSEPDLKALIAAGALAAAANAHKNDKPDYRLDAVQLDPLIPNPSKIICIGLNYHEHRNETKMTGDSYPAIFIRFADTQIGHLADVIRPKASEQLDYEAELAVIIGKTGRHIRERDALNHIAGYSCYNDVSVRDHQRHSSQWTPGKNFPATGPFGPFLVTPDEVGELAGKKIQTRLNRDTVQSSTLDMMIFPVPKLIEYISSFTPLYPGDVIATGTPGGVGWVRKPPLWMKPGDTVEIDIEGVGLLKNRIVAED